MAELRGAVDATTRDQKGPRTFHLQGLQEALCLNDGGNSSFDTSSTG